ncbi:MAG: DUF4832 domain-containing protein [Bdellovibrionales bacterium]|nr:DUF4832 domain-containing protein [Bdellovibrionales bacterium]
MSILLSLLFSSAFAAEPKITVVRPREIGDILVNPGIGFTTFQRFQGDALNAGDQWPEGYLGQTKVPTRRGGYYPDSSIAYIRIYWKEIEPLPGKYQWSMITEAIEKAKKRGQKLMIRLMPYGEIKNTKEDVPNWYREIGREPIQAKYPNPAWRIDHTRPEYRDVYGRLIDEFAKNFDGNEGIEAVDISFVGPWGEGSGSDLLPEPIHQDLLNRYLNGFKKTHLIAQMADVLGPKTTVEKAPTVGLRFDCVGDAGIFSKTWSHMLDLYPQAIIKSGMKNAWIERPVSLEACGVMDGWKKFKVDVDYMIDQTLKWHVSSFNAKSSNIPPEWKPKIKRWLNQMGYRLVLRKFTFPEESVLGEKIAYTSWWENKGVAPPYQNYPVALRLKNEKSEHTLILESDIRKWLPGDNLLDGSVSLPTDFPAGEFDIALGLVNPTNRSPAVRLAIHGRTSDGWYPLGKIRIGPKQ